MHMLLIAVEGTQSVEVVCGSTYIAKPVPASPSGRCASPSALGGRWAKGSAVRNLIADRDLEFRVPWRWANRGLDVWMPRS